MTTVKVAIAQFESANDVKDNRQKLVTMTEKAAASGARLVMFHEIATTQYFCYDHENTEHFASAETVPGTTTDELAEVSRRTGCSVLLPMYEKDGGKLFNTVVYIDSEAGVVGKYEKSHIPDTGFHDGRKGADEKFYFSSGRTGFEIPAPLAGISVGTMICYDRHFPEGTRAYSLQGAHLMFTPTATYRGFFAEIWKAELQTLAFQNNMYVAGVNKVGRVVGEGISTDARYPGDSVIVNPEGRIIAECGDGEEIAYADIDPAFCDKFRSGPMSFISRRRPELYGLLTERK